MLAQQEQHGNDRKCNDTTQIKLTEASTEQTTSQIISPHMQRTPKHISDTDGTA